MNPYGVPGISPQELANKLNSDEHFFLLDVREPHELNYAKITDERLIPLPLSKLAREQTTALPGPLRSKMAPIIVMCHHGVRSAQVTSWLLGQGWTEVINLDGGIDAYAKTVDKSVGMY